MYKTPIFIIGINPRSGTNYLYNLLGTHPDCVFSNHFGEDFILSGAHKYLDFIETVTHKWRSDWNNNKADFKSAMESGILRYLDPVGSPARYMISKTPDPSFANLFLQIFSKGYLILITRNGQDLVESFTQTFNSRFEDSVRGWVRGARWIDKIIGNETMMKSGRVILIRYEDLYQKNEEVMSKLLEFLHLDKSKYDFERSRNFDVIGSSVYTGNSGVVTWDPIPKNDTFNPIKRFEHWGILKHYRFNWLAGRYSKEFGYTLYHETHNPFYYIYNILLTAYSFLFRFMRRTGIIMKAFGKNRKELKRALQVELK
jgi:hypothetical protein